MTICKISQEEAYHRCDPNSFSFETNSEVEEPSHFIGQGPGS